MLTVDEYMALRRLIDSERESEGAMTGDERVQAARAAGVAPSQRKRRKRNTAYARAFKKVQKKYKLKSGKWKKGGFGKAVREAHKIAKRSKK